MAATTMCWLILPDIHDKLRRANQIIEREPHDRLLLMGDFLDGGRLEIKSYDALTVAAKAR